MALFFQRNRNWLGFSLVAAFVLFFAVYGQAANGGTPITEYTGPDLPVVGSQENLIKLLEECSSQQDYYSLRLPALAGSAKKEMAADNQAQSTDAAGAPGNDHSTTNLQVAGVDEADLVKTDGEYIYQVNRQQVVIARAYPADKMEVVSQVKFPEGEFNPQELYLDGQRLVVIGSSSGNVYPMKDRTEPVIYPPYPAVQTVKAIVYDISDKSNLKKLREIELEGNYVSSRKIEAALYLVAQRSVHYYPYYPAQQEGNAPLAPSYRDTAQGSGFIRVEYGDIRYFPKFVEPNYVMIAGVDLSQPQKTAKVATYLGASDNIYASPKNLYVAVTRYQYDKPVIVKEAPAPVEGLIRPFFPPTMQNTNIYRFALSSGDIKYTGSGEVPGRILNQFSMDEYSDSFRIATTQQQPWRSDRPNAQSNSVYVLDDQLSITGRLEDIAPGERIYSARFMGERGYLVTFEKVDPFFVLDLKDPANPRLLGALKIPGYSDYLHPYDENHIIGFGKDTVELPIKNHKGNVVDTQAYYLGMKIAVFDVTDVTQPREMFTERIGDRGTESELLHNHKALLFSREKNLLAFPITVREVKDEQKYRLDGRSFPQYGTFSFQGAYVYRLDLDSGFTLRGRITHLTDEDYLKSGDHYYYGDKNVERIIYINDNLYTLSKSMIKAHGMDNLEERGSVSIN